jgi:hypothetical protein
MDPQTPRHEDDLSDFERRLAGWQPASGSLDADTMLFAAGRGSARPNRAWIALAAALTVAQTLTLALWWSQPAPPVAQVPPPTTPLPASPAPPEPPTYDSSENPALWSAYHSLRGSDLEDRPEPASAGKFVESGPPLRAFGSSLPSIMN